MSGPHEMQHLKNQYCSNCKRKKLEDRVKDSASKGAWRGSVAKFDFWGKIQKSCVKNSMTYRLPNSRKSNFATEPDVQGANLLKQVSPVAWQHINCFGRYEFRKGPEAINVHEIVRELAQLPGRLASAG